MPDHVWVPCYFKNATFCMVCGKLTSQLGEIPLDESNQVASYVYKHGPNVNRQGLRCQVCLMTIHDECLERARNNKISMGCTGAPDPRSGTGHFVREGVSKIKLFIPLNLYD